VWSKYVSGGGVGVRETRAKPWHQRGDGNSALSNAALQPIFNPSASFPKPWQTTKRSCRASQTPTRTFKQVNPPHLSPTVLKLISHPDLQSIVSARQKLESQQHENKGVQKVPIPSSHTLPTFSASARTDPVAGIRQATTLIKHLQARRARSSKTRAQRSRHGR